MVRIKPAAENSLYDPATGGCLGTSTVPCASATNSASELQACCRPSTNWARMVTCSPGRKPLVRITGDSSIRMRLGLISRVCAERERELNPIPQKQNIKKQASKDRSDLIGEHSSA